MNARNTNVAEDLQFIIQSTFPGVLTGENCICIEASLIQDHQTTVVLTIILSAHHFS